MSAPSPLPLAPEPALQTAARLLAEGRPDAAAERLGALVAEAPTYAAAYVLHATALEAAGQSAEALDAWGHAAFLVPRSPLVRRERQRLAALFAPPPDEEAPPVAPDDVATQADAPADRPDATAPPDAADPPGIDWAPDGPADAEPAPSAPDPLGANAPETAPDAFDEPAIEGLPLESLAAMFETDTPFFEDDDAETDESAAPESGLDPATPVPDWGDLPPLGTPLLAPDPPPAPAAAPPAVPQAGDGPPDGWRILDTTDGPPAASPSDIATPADAPDESTPDDAPDENAPIAGTPDEPGLTFEHPFADASPPSEGTGGAGDDLDALISQLEQAPRIRPDPTFAAPAVRTDESGVDEMVSETLAKIYAAQHRYVEAAVMYEKLAAREPAQADAMLRRAAELRGRR